jgi:hypothetical protein
LKGLLEGLALNPPTLKGVVKEAERKLSVKKQGMILAI